MKKNKNVFIVGSVLAIFCLALLGIYLLSKSSNLNLTKVQSPTSYKKLYDVMKVNFDTHDDRNESVLEIPKTDSSTSSNPGGDYSKTNIQVSGVDEADIVKTDGKYIYMLSDEYLYIVEVNDDVMNIASKIKSQENIENSSYKYQEIYVTDNKLIVIKNMYEYPEQETEENTRSGFYWNGQERVSIVIFDVTDKTKPVKINELSQSGSYLSSRLVDNYVYVTTNYYIYDKPVQKELKTYVPTLDGKAEKIMAIEDIIIMPNPVSKSYLVVTGTDLNDSSDFKSSKAVLGSSTDIYVDKDNLYIAGYEDEKVGKTYVSKTNLVKFSMTQGKLNLEASGSVKGHILNQFSMDEYNDYFRIVTTSDDYKIYEIDEVISPNESDDMINNNLYVLDKDLKEVSKLAGLAEGERVYSVRFDGDIAYFVTFEQVDPLFVVDLSNPKEPIIKSELKIPGFSEYLHVFNDKYLFGLGKEADAEGTITNLKISMYDIQNKSDVVEKYKIVIGDETSYSEASYNHKAILVSNSKNLIGFPMNDKYLVYKFTDNVGFEKISEIDYSGTKENFYYYYGDMRGLYINDYLYVVNPYQIRTLNLKTLKKGDIFELSSFKPMDDFAR